MLARLHDPQHKVDDHRGQQQHRQRRGPEPVVEARLAPDSDRSRTPVVRPQRVQERAHSNAREAEGGDLGGAVAKVEHAHGEGTDDNGEVQPGQEGTFVGEVDFGLDAGREGDALAWCVVMLVAPFETRVSE